GCSTYCRISPGMCCSSGDLARCRIGMAWAGRFSRKRRRVGGTVLRKSLRRRRRANRLRLKRGMLLVRRPAFGATAVRQTEQVIGPVATERALSCQPGGLRNEPYDCDQGGSPHDYEQRYGVPRIPRPVLYVAVCRIRIIQQGISEKPTHQ